MPGAMSTGRYPRPSGPIAALRAFRAHSSFLSMRSASVHPNAFVRRGSILTPNTSVGAYSRINGPCVIRDRGEFTVGRWNAIGYQLHVVTANHAMSSANMVLALDHYLGLPRPADTRGGVSIGNACWIGDRVTLLPGARIGDGAIIGAGSVVTSCIPPFSVAMGVPARVARPRFQPEIADLLVKLSWWEWTIERIARNRSFFALDLTTSPPDVVLDVIVE